MVYPKLKLDGGAGGHWVSAGDGEGAKEEGGVLLSSSLKLLSL